MIGLLEIRARGYNAFQEQTTFPDVDSAEPQAQEAQCGRGRHEAREGGDVIGIERIQGTAQRLIIEMVGCDQHGCSESRYRCIREQPRDQRKLLVHQAEAVEDHRFDGIARGHDPRLWMVSGRAVNDLTYAEFIEHTRDKAQMV